MTVTSYLGDWNFQRAISMVIPRSRSDLSLSRTQAYLKEPLPSSAASCTNLLAPRLRDFTHNGAKNYPYLLELLNGTGIDTTALVDEVT